MATDDQQVLVAGTASAPADFRVPGNGQIQPKSVFAHYDGTSATVPFQPALKVYSDGGELVAICPCPTTVAAAGSADVSWFPHVIPPDQEGAGAGVIVETLLMDTRVSTGVTSSTVLSSGQEYVITAQGTFSNVNHSLDVGSPQPNALFPTPGARTSTQVGFDPECVFAYYSAGPPTGGLGHSTNNFQMNLGSGFAYVTPQDGTHAMPAPNSLYTYRVLGQGHTASFKFVDNPAQYADNYGYIQVTIQSTQGSSGGGGSGSLLPPVGSDSSLLRIVSGVPAWEAQPDITEADLSLSNVTTGNVSTSRHGFAPIAPNDATQFLNGTGAYSTPAGASPLTTKGDVFGHSTVDARIPVGSNNQVLTADSAQTLGLKWAGAVNSLDSITGAVSLVAGSNITISDNNPSAGNITITASGSGVNTELDYVQITSGVNVTHTTDATADTIITGHAVTYSGSQRIKVEFWTQDVTVPSGNAVTIVLYDGSTDLGRMGTSANHTASVNDQALYGVTFLTPSAGSHTFSIRAWIFSAATGTIGAGAGGAGVNLPAWYRITTA